MRKDDDGADVPLGVILEAVENGPLKHLHNAILSQQADAFEKAYRETIVGCYSWRQASDKPYLHPQIPVRPATPIINFAPHASWPQ